MTCSFNVKRLLLCGLLSLLWALLASGCLTPLRGGSTAPTAAPPTSPGRTDLQKELENARILAKTFKERHQAWKYRKVQAQRVMIGMSSWGTHVNPDNPHSSTDWVEPVQPSNAQDELIAAEEQEKFNAEQQDFWEGKVKELENKVNAPETPEGLDKGGRGGGC